MREECKHLKGRMRDLCDGHGYDGRPHPTQEASDSYRDSIGLAPIEVSSPDENTSHSSGPRVMMKSSPSTRDAPSVSQIGTTLSRLFRERVGQVPCGWCKSKIAALNQMTVESVLSRIDTLSREIVQNARKKGSWWVRLTLWADEKGHGGVANAVVRSFIKEACDIEQQQKALS